MNDSLYLKILEELYQKALSLEECPKTVLSKDLIYLVNNILNNKAVVTVLLTCMLEKVIHPNQDVRKHQAGIPGGFSGRSLDSKVVTPFLKNKGLPHMAESGWLTRSLEQPHLYDLNFPGKIRGDGVKEAFLRVFDVVERNEADASQVLTSLLYLIINKNNSLIKEFNSPFSEEDKKRLNSKEVFLLIKNHITSSTEAGTSKLPVLLMYAIVSLQLKEYKKYQGCFLGELKSHTTSDKSSKSFGDIEVYRETLKEVIEVKHNRPVSREMVFDCFKKIKEVSIDALFIFTTGEILLEGREEAEKIKKEFGHNIILLNIYDYLESILISINEKELLEEYARLVFEDRESLKEEHKNRLVYLMNEIKKGP